MRDYVFDHIISTFPAQQKIHEGKKVPSVLSVVSGLSLMCFEWTAGWRHVLMYGNAGAVGTDFFPKDSGGQVWTDTS